MINTTSKIMRCHTVMVVGKAGSWACLRRSARIPSVVAGTSISILKLDHIKHERESDENPYSTLHLIMGHTPEMKKKPPTTI
jgi:hypothetical protein